MKLSLIAAVFTLVAATAGAQPSNPDEAATGAAAIAVVALHCNPSAYEEVRAHALRDLAEMLRQYPADARAAAHDSAERKIRALSIANQGKGCEGTRNLQLMARTWGFGHYLRTR